MNYQSLIGRKVRITAVRKACELLKLNFEPYSFDAVLQEVNEEYIKIKEQSGMIRYFPLEDKYLVVKNIVAI